MHPGIDAKRTVCANQPGDSSLKIGKTRPPDQRSVTKNPEIRVGVIETGVHGGLHLEKTGSRIRLGHWPQPPGQRRRPPENRTTFETPHSAASQHA
jgi:hypothetical protein